jgi:hypothetical protein
MMMIMMMNMEKSVKCLTGKTEVLGELLPQQHLKELSQWEDSN